jgi:hypothetical protein
MSDKWKSAVLLFILVVAATAFALLCKYLGLFVPRMNWGFGSCTINETLSNVGGYFVAALLALYFCGLVYADFDRKRRMYKMVDRILDPVFNGVLGLLGVREK